MTPKELTALVEKVCGSDTLRAQYEELEARKRAAEERAAFQHTRKKNLLAEKRQKKEQRDEAEKHQKLMEELVRCECFFLSGFSSVRVFQLSVRVCVCFSVCIFTTITHMFSHMQPPQNNLRSGSNVSCICFRCFTLSRICSVHRNLLICMYVGGHVV